MATKSSDKPKTTTLYSKHGTKVTVSEEQAKRVGGQFTATKPKSS